jgi:hypothetical protein
VDLAAVSKVLMVVPVVVGETVGEDPVVDPMVVSEATMVQAWRWSRSRHASGVEMIVARVRV